MSSQTAVSVLPTVQFSAELDPQRLTDLTRRAATDPRLYPDDLRSEIDELDRWLDRRLAPRASWPDLLAAFQVLDQVLESSRYLLGDQVTRADLHLLVFLLRHEARVESGSIGGPRPSDLSYLWGFAQELSERTLR